MEAIRSTASMTLPREPANYDEVSMQQSLLFSDSLEDLKNLRKQLYSAAEYFELSYTNDDQKHVVVNTLKDYAIKALVNTVDHLGSVSYKVNDMLDEKVDEVSGTELRVSCIEQRLRTCQEYIDREGLSQQSLVINTPKYHKRYILPGETNSGANHSKSSYYGCSIDDEDEWHQFRNAVRATIKETPPEPPMRNGHRSQPPSPRVSQLPGSFSFSGTLPKKELDKRTVSPHRFPLLRTASFASRQSTPKKSRPTTPNPSRPTTPNASFGRQFPSEPRKSASMRIDHPQRGGSPRDGENNPSKSKRLLKSLLSRRKSKKDDLLYTYLDEY
ncbi:OLC1v1027873C1 [Oldenlandia corymbosa var. corymbosa]|uniref:OLC1v1027873C1 n=1 Tax=Oldenlandia corymbosa var. corymbosa TaxID=529605 RepID=A0AAV1CD62_OLDCO|nr:OLC1v1027873C1 [Oldenlandia corymbosa var. corymbosa]